MKELFSGNLRSGPPGLVLIRFRSPVDPPRWPSLPPVTIRDLDGLPARWDDDCGALDCMELGQN
jgi:hypothetical protein